MPINQYVYWICTAEIIERFDKISTTHSNRAITGSSVFGQILRNCYGMATMNIRTFCSPFGHKFCYFFFFIERIVLQTGIE